MLVNVALMFALNAEYAAIVSPADGLLIPVIVVPWWLASVVFLVNKFAHSVALTLLPAATADSSVPCPYPNSSLPTPIIELILATD